MKIEIIPEESIIRLTGTNGKAILIYHNKEADTFQMSICQKGFEHSCLPTVTFCKENTTVLNNLPMGRSFVD